ncbi:hypothetical protein GTW51_10160 [Aurantimonas aggregata]|uniref:Uncharacterized protein n=1 Tax=Aurantimonas aggregata TaxID=2047720 RepID=A0A6L9MGV9_9HYPH|nr:hypothetical protein [Aurantimonas aggregata]NDV87065.1 hypothetical protein [Aurantimonas aggregata]
MAMTIDDMAAARATRAHMAAQATAQAEQQVRDDVRYHVGFEMTDMALDAAKLRFRTEHLYRCSVLRGDASPVAILAGLRR